MDSLRLVLLVAGVIFVAAIYVFERLRHRRIDERYSQWGSGDESDYTPGKKSFAAQASSARPASSLDYDDETNDQFDEQEASRKDAIRDIAVELKQLEGFIASRDEDVEQLEMEGLSVEGDANSANPPEANKQPEEILVVNIFARDGRVLSGPDILEVAVQHDLQFGDMGFFHRKDESGNTLFSMANALQPGSFDIADMESLATRGLVFFMRLPGDGDPAVNFDMMLTTARDIGNSLQAQLHDETRSVLTRQGIEAIRTRINEYKLKARANVESA